MNHPHGTGNATIDDAIAKLHQLIRDEQEAGRNPLSTLLIMAPLKNGDVFAAESGCCCNGCRRLMAEKATRLYMQEMLGARPQSTAPVH